MARPMRACTKPGCREMADYTESYCSKHKGAAAKQYNEQVRFSKENKHIAAFYNSKEWKQVRNSFIYANPLCKRCLDEGAVTPAKIVHHI
ncbi:HNH endonuclease, partial [Bacillus sp. mrc49]|uniref:HNH endonuclease n=1 Tax=Bacillus sp. mrc49 TaxID=2054913 RepID=UPI000C275E9C